MTDRPIPRLEMGNGFWELISSTLKASGEPCGDLGGLKCYTNALVPDNMAVLINDKGEIRIIDLRTDEEPGHDRH